MTEALDPGQIETLLAANDDAENDAFSNQAAFSGADTSRRAVAAYDFKRPKRVSKDHIRALISIHDGFARNFGATLSGLLRTIIDVRVVGVEQLTYSEFVHALPNPTCFILMQAPPLEGQMCLEVSPLIVYPIIDRLLGGHTSELFIPQRPLTSIEWRLMARIVDRALDHLSEVWRNLVDARFAAMEHESNPQLVHIVAPTEVVVFITFEIKMGACAGTMSLCIPFNTIETILSKLTTQTWFGYKPKGASDLHQRRILRNLTRTTVGLTAYLGEARIRLSEMRSLRPGDILQLDKRADREFVLQIEGRTKFAGLAGQLRGRRAVRITRAAEIDEPL